MIRTPASGAPPNDSDDWENASVTILPRASTVESSGDVESATQAMQGLRILQPPPTGADDGGAYSRIPGLAPQAHQTPGRDPGQPLSAATASAHGPLDPVLVACLENARERLTLLKFEDQIVRFLRSPREPHLNFPPLSSYHRLIVHRLAQRCALEHQTAEYNPYEGSSARVVTLFKTPQSAVPRVLLIDLSADRQAPAVTPASAPKIMMRKRGVQQPGANGGRGNGADGKATRSMQDRERAYAEARARIFGDDSASSSPAATNSAAESLSSSSPSSMASSASGAGPSNSVNSRLGNSRQAAGPDGSKGFGRGRGGAASGLSDRSSGGSGRNQSTQSSKGPTDAGEAPRSTPSARSAQNTAHWKESKVLWRNREQELNDPDFTRHHDAFRPVRTGSGGGAESPYHGIGTGGYNRFASGLGRHGHGNSTSSSDYHQYDRSYDRSFDQNGSSFQPQAAGAPPPPLPTNAGRGPYPNRVDTSHHMYQRTAPQFQQYPQQLVTPPPLPMGRGGYGYASPRGHPAARGATWTPQQPTNTRGGGSFVDDDFPPLGK